MKMKRLLFISMVLLMLLLLSACGAPATPLATATPLPLPTATLSPEALQETVLTAAREDDVEAMKQYIAAGADINQSGELGATPLSIAAFRGNVEMVRLLLDAGATFEIGVFHTAIAESNDDTEIVQVFLDHSVEIDKQAEIGNGHTALMYAAEFGHIEVGKLLLENGADINAGDNFNDPALNVAAFHGQLEFAQMLVEMGAELNVQGFGDRTALGHAISQGHEDVAAFLGEAGATE
jgi:ankyrin repeat protein